MNIDSLLSKMANHPKELASQLKQSPKMLPINSDTFIRHAQNQIKTSESVGTLNSLPDQSEHSFVIANGLLTDKLEKGSAGRGVNIFGNSTPRQDPGCSRRSGYSRLEEELTKIEKMKHMYESRQKLSQNKSSRKAHNISALSHGNKSLEKKSVSSIHEQSENFEEDHEHGYAINKILHKSLDKKKHTLKPSNTPSFNKLTNNRENKSLVEHKSDATLIKNIYLEEFLENSQSEAYKEKHSLETSQRRKLTRQPDTIRNMVKGAGLNHIQHENYHDQDYKSHELPFEEMSVIEQASSDKRGAHLPQISQNPQKAYKNQSRVSYAQHQKSQLEEIESYQDESSSFLQHQDKESSCNLDRFISPDNQSTNTLEHHPQRIINKFEHTPSPMEGGVSKKYIEEMMSMMERKYECISNKMARLEQENRELRQRQQEVDGRLARYQEIMKESEVMRDKIRQQDQQKQELEAMLKDILYQREKEKLQLSKENTCRDNETKKIYQQYQHQDRMPTSKQNMSSRLANQQARKLYMETSSEKELHSQHSTHKYSQQNQYSKLGEASKMKVQNLLQKLHIKVDRA